MSENKTDKPKKTAIAREDNGNIQITLNIPYKNILEAKKSALEEIAKTTDVPGFRKGNAPVDQVEKNVSESKVLEKALGKILPKAFSDIAEKENIKPIVYPKFELITAKENEDWQVRATTCELPEVNLKDYKKIISDEAKSKTIWTPEKGDPKGESQEKEKTPEEKEQEVIKILLDNIKVKIPKILIDQEVDNRLAQLLDRIEKLGLNLESYLASVGKNPEILRKEYEVQASNTIVLDLILQKISVEEKIEVEEKEIEGLIKATSADPKLAESLNTPEQKRYIRSIILKRKALESLVLLL
ncbi:MAG: trigger factor [Patescibacteria group bacterium]